MRRFFSFIAGATCGALVGSVVALLLAPSSGDEIRLRFRDRVTAIGEELREAYDARVAQLEDELERLRSPQA